MEKDSLLERIKTARRQGTLGVDANNCLQQLIFGSAGQFQLFYKDKVYCSKSEEYCPFQSESEKALKKCIGQKLHMELIDDRYGDSTKT